MIDFYPGATFVEIPESNYAVGRFSKQLGMKVTPIIIVVHIAQGTEAGTDSHFRNPESQVSSHLLICKDGRKKQYVRLNDTAYTNGVDPNDGYASYKSDMSNKYINKLWNLGTNGVNFNPFSLTIECEGKSGEFVPSAQYESLLDAIQTLAHMAGFINPNESIVFDPKRIVGHYMINAVDKPFCPGTRLDIHNIRNIVTNRILKGNVPMDAVLVKRVEDVLHRLWKLSNELVDIHHEQEAIELQKEVVEIKKILGLQ